jgi:hypothetical protein
MIDWILDRLRRRKDYWDTDKDGLTQINYFATDTPSAAEPQPNFQLTRIEA